MLSRRAGAMVGDGGDTLSYNHVCIAVRIVVCPAVDAGECGTQRSRSLYCTQEISCHG